MTIPKCLQRYKKNREMAKKAYLPHPTMSGIPHTIFVPLCHEQCQCTFSVLSVYLLRVN